MAGTRSTGRSTGWPRGRQGHVDGRVGPWTGVTDDGRDTPSCLRFAASELETRVPLPSDGWWVRTGRKEVRHAFCENFYVHNRTGQILILLGSVRIRTFGVPGRAPVGDGHTHAHYLRPHTPAVRTGPPTRKPVSRVYVPTPRSRPPAPLPSLIESSAP